MLPLSKSEAHKRSWKQLDIVIVTGDAYVDHPSFGAAVIGRVLEAQGFRVGILAQPDWRSVAPFREFGRPRLFFGITAGNVDSMLANRTVNRRRRRKDDYSPGGKPGLRPDQATIVYSNRVREAFPGVPIVLGGIEASLRRFAYYDFWKDSVRPSILLESRADLLVYGMGERQVVEIAHRLDKGESLETLTDIRGTTCIVKTKPDGALEIPSFEEVSGDRRKFAEAHVIFEANLDPIRGRVLAQAHGKRCVIQNLPPLPATEAELDEIYALPFTRKYHPSYEKSGGVPALETVRTTITTHRGCFANCSFCALAAHQGKIIENRSVGSIVAEACKIAEADWFKGTISSVGAPSANMYAYRCKRNWHEKGTCGRRDCLLPKSCPSLVSGTEQNIEALRRIREIPGIKHVFISHGIRYDLALKEPQYLRELIKHHISGYLIVGLEQVNPRILKLMNKPPIEIFEKFEKEFEKLNRELGKKQYLVRYLILGHPGCMEPETRELASWLKKRKLRPQQVQDFYPCPMTASSCMYYSGYDPRTMEKVESPRRDRDRRRQRKLIQHPGT
jgi:uncharacterized radical SAM protein YgiQ